MLYPLFKGYVNDIKHIELHSRSLVNNTMIQIALIPTLHRNVNVIETKHTCICSVPMTKQIFLLSISSLVYYRSCCKEGIFEGANANTSHTWQYSNIGVNNRKCKVWILPAKWTLFTCTCKTNMLFTSFHSFKAGKTVNI